jgi:hypothetical protein
MDSAAGWPVMAARWAVRRSVIGLVIGFPFGLPICDPAGGCYKHLCDFARCG